MFICTICPSAEPQFDEVKDVTLIAKCLKTDKTLHLIMCDEYAKEVCSLES